jgi:hypothetical protein
MKKSKEPKKKPTRIAVEVPERLKTAVNTLVRYYADGWRAGYLESFNKMGAAVIRPIGAIGGTKPQTVNVECSSIELISDAPESPVVKEVTEEIVSEPEKPESNHKINGAGVKCEHGYFWNSCTLCPIECPEPEPEKPKRKKREKKPVEVPEERDELLNGEFTKPPINELVVTDEVKKTKRGRML